MGLCHFATCIYKLQVFCRVIYCSMKLKQMQDLKFHNTSCRQDLKTELWKPWWITEKNTTCRGSFLYASLMITQLWRELKYACTTNLPPINGTNQHTSPDSRGIALIYIKYWTTHPLLRYEIRVCILPFTGNSWNIPFILKKILGTHYCNLYIYSNLPASAFI